MSFAFMKSICYFGRYQLSAYIQTNTMNVDNQFLLREGHTNVAHYGIRLSEVAGIPASVVNHARVIAAKIDANVCILTRMVDFRASDALFLFLHYRNLRSYFCCRVTYGTGKN